MKARHAGSLPFPSLPPAAVQVKAAIQLSVCCICFHRSGGHSPMCSISQQLWACSSTVQEPFGCFLAAPSPCNHPHTGLHHLPLCSVCCKALNESCINGGLHSVNGYLVVALIIWQARVRTHLHQTWRVHALVFMAHIIADKPAKHCNMHNLH